MSDIYPIKSGFNGGYISGSSRGRVSAEEYANGLAECENFLITPQGSAATRSGSRFESVANFDWGRLIQFPRGVGKDVVVNIDGDKVAIRDRSGIIEGAGLFLNDPTFAQKNVYWLQGGLGNNAVWKNDPGFRLLMQVGNGVGAGFSHEIFVDQRVTAPADTYTFKFSYASETGASTSTTYLADKANLRVTISTTQGGAAIAGGNALAPAVAWGVPQETVMTFTTAGSSFWIRMQLERVVAVANPLLHGAIYTPMVLAGSDITPLVFNSPWDASQVASIHTAMDSGTMQMYFAHPEVAPYVLDYDAGTLAWSFAAADFGINKPTSWDGTNWPSCCEFFQSRLWLAGTPEDPSRIWASVTGAYTDFEIGVLDTSALDLVLSASGSIQWLKGHNQLFIGTNAGEWECGSESGLITPADVQFFRQSGYGSAHIQPVHAGQQIAFVGLDARKVRVSNQSNEARGWVSSDISMIANDLFNSGIVRIVYAGDPIYQMYCLLADGNVASCTYDRFNNLLAWAQLTTNGYVFSICNTDELSGQAVWILVRRASGTFIEIFDPEPTVHRFLDSFVTGRPRVVSPPVGGAYSVAFSSAYDGGFRDTEVKKYLDGLNHLVGQTVGVVGYAPLPVAGEQLAVYFGLFTVAADGSVLLPSYVPDADFSAGLLYTCKLVTLPQEGGQKEGTAQGSIRRFNRIFQRVVHSILSFTNGYKPRVPKKQIPIFLPEYSTALTGDFDVHAKGFDGGVVTVIQDIPLRTEISALYGKTTSENF